MRVLRILTPLGTSGHRVSVQTICGALSPTVRAALLRRRRAHCGERFFQGVDLRLHGGELRAQRADIEEHLILHRGIELGGVTEPG